MQHSLASLVAIAGLMIATRAQAREFASKLCDKGTSVDHVIDPIILRSTALDGATTDTLDYDHDGAISADEMFRSLTTDAFAFCTVRTSATAGRANACADGQEDALRLSGSRLTGFWLQNGVLFDLTIIAAPIRRRATQYDANYGGHESESDDKTGLPDVGHGVPPRRVEGARALGTPSGESGEARASETGARLLMAPSTSAKPIAENVAPAPMLAVRGFAIALRTRSSRPESPG